MSDCRECDKYKDNMPCYDDYRFCEKSLKEHNTKTISDALDELREYMIHNADQKGLDAFDKSVEEYVTDRRDKCTS